MNAVIYICSSWFLQQFWCSSDLRLISSAQRHISEPFSWRQLQQLMQWINHCCWMISFTSCFELKLLILFTYWNIKSLIRHLSCPSFIILAAAMSCGPVKMSFKLPFIKLPTFVPVYMHVPLFHFQLGSISCCLSASWASSFHAFIYQMAQHPRVCLPHSWAD